MKEEIERRRAEAAERRQKVGEEVDGDTSKPFKCVSPRGSSLKVSSHSFSPSLPCFSLFFLVSVYSLTHRTTLAPPMHILLSLSFNERKDSLST